MSTSIRGRIPITQLTANVAQQKDAESRCLPDPELDDTPEQSKRTQNGQLLNDFEGSSLYSLPLGRGLELRSRDSLFAMTFQNWAMSSSSGTMAVGVNNPPASVYSLWLTETNFNYIILSRRRPAYDYIGAIRRLSDNSFTADVAAYFPLDSEYQQYLKSVPTSTAKATCNYLEVVNKQDKKKFRIWLSPERFANSGYALAMALRNHKPSEEFTCKLQIEVDDVDEAATTTYSHAMPSTWRSGSKDFPDQLASIKKCGGEFQHCMYKAIRFMHRRTWPKTFRQQREKRNHYIGLSISFKDQVAEWQITPRKTYKQGKEAVSVYKHSVKKLSIYKSMLAEDDTFASTLVPKSKIAKFLDHGLKIEDHQLKLKQLIQDTTEHDLQAWRKEIASRTPKFRDQIAAFRRDQKHLMAKVGDKVAAQTALGPAIEDEKLFLPSDLTESEREDGCCFSRHRGVQMAGRTGIRHLAGPPTHRENHKCPAQSQGSARLDFFDGSTNFLYSPKGTVMKSVQQKRHVSDSKRTDGLLWRAAALATIGSYDRDVEMTEPEQADEDGDPALVAGTQMDRRKSAKKIVEKSNKADMGRGDGWLWQLGKLTKMSNTEMEAWANEGGLLLIAVTFFHEISRDRVQWFRAEAEMQRWQEQWEQKLVELLRIRRSFGKMESVWVLLADMQPPEAHGSKAYARQKVAIGRDKIKAVGYGQLLDETADVVALIEAERKTEAAVMNAALNGVAQ
ncbi:hypothetical protein B0H13DRAFT_1908520 [Mycena leptocephala]|nr:hypothetical protein B0H13DRAFT_1908520 [Mycena leptocephala]